MYDLGPRLVLRGAVAGCITLTISLLMITAGLSAPALPPTAPKPEQTQIHPESEASVIITSQADPVAINPSQECLVSDRFPENILQWCSDITTYATKHGLPPDLIAAVIWQESGGDPVAYSKSGAVGLMQVMPSDGLAAAFNCINGPCFSDRPTSEELKDPEFNISYGTKLLGSLVNRTGSLREGLKSYGPMNMGYYYADKVLGILSQYGN